VQTGVLVPGDVPGDGVAGGRAAGPGIVAGELALDGAEEAFGQGVVPALPGSSVRQDDAVVLGQGGVFGGGVLAAARFVQVRALRLRQTLR